MDVLLREVDAIDPTVTAESVENMIEYGGLSWAEVESQRKEVVVGKLRAIGNLDEHQCGKLFDKLDVMMSIDPEIKRRNSILFARRFFHGKWITKCMYSAFDCV